MRIAKKGVHNYTENDLTIYYVGSYRGYDEANKIKTEIIIRNSNQIKKKIKIKFNLNISKFHNAKKKNI